MSGPQLGLDRYAIYVQDYGAPIGWRLALSRPGSISAIVTQSGNGYDEGFIDGFWKTVWDYQREQTPETEAAIRTALEPESVAWQYLTGGSSRVTSSISRGNWRKPSKNRTHQQYSEEIHHGHHVTNPNSPRGGARNPGRPDPCARLCSTASGDWTL